MSKQKCGICGKDPAEGWAKIDDTRYCHGDFDPEPTCYMSAQRHLVDLDKFDLGWKIEIVEGDAGG